MTSATRPSNRAAPPGSLQRIGDAEGAAERAYRTNVDAQRAADRTGVPRLSAESLSSNPITATTVVRRKHPMVQQRS
jgi:hypothetical protein